MRVAASASRSYSGSTILLGWRLDESLFYYQARRPRSSSTDRSFIASSFAAVAVDWPLPLFPRFCVSLFSADPFALSHLTFISSLGNPFPPIAFHHLPSQSTPHYPTQPNTSAQPSPPPQYYVFARVKTTSVNFYSPTPDASSAIPDTSLPPPTVASRTSPSSPPAHHYSNSSSEWCKYCTALGYPREDRYCSLSTDT